MNPPVPPIRVDALSLLTFSVVILGLVVLLPCPAHAAEERLVGDVVVGPRGVEHDVSTGAGDIEVRGPVEGDVHSGFGDVYVDAPIKGDVNVGWGDVDLGPKAEISGNLEGEGGEITGNRSAVKGDMMAKGMAIDFDESHGPSIIGFFGWLFAALAFSACAVLAAVVAPRPLASAASRAEESPGRSFVYGLVSLP